MFDISWTEFLLIGIVALIVIGPKELPNVMRTMGQWTRKVRSMAADFQNQFHEAMREAEMADLKKQVDEIAQDVKEYDPLKDVRADVEAIGRDLSTNPSMNLSKDAGKGPESPAAISPVEELPLPPAAAELQDQADHQADHRADHEADRQAIVDAAAGPVAPEAAAEKHLSDSAGHAE
jgi:sec-independent protein translocase protein TatB